MADGDPPCLMGVVTFARELPRKSAHASAVMFVNSSVTTSEVQVVSAIGRRYTIAWKRLIKTHVFCQLLFSFSIIDHSLTSRHAGIFLYKIIFLIKITLVYYVYLCPLFVLFFNWHFCYPQWRSRTQVFCMSICLITRPQLYRR